MVNFTKGKHARLNIVPPVARETGTWMLYHPSRGSVSGNSRRENRWMTMGVRSGTSPSWDQLAVTASHDHILPPSPPFLSDLEGRTQVVWLCTREKGTTGLPQFLTVALSYIRRDLKSAGGVAVSVGNYSTSLPRVQEPVACCVTRAEPMCRPSRAGLVRSNSSLVEHKDRSG